MQTSRSDWDPIVLPSLRYLATLNTKTLFVDRLDCDISMLTRILPQLEAWSIDIEGLGQALCPTSIANLVNLRRCFSILDPFLPLALVDCPLLLPFSCLRYSESLKYIYHLRVTYKLSFLSGPYFSQFTQTILSRPSSSPLRSIYLKSFPEIKSEAYQALEGPVLELERVCKAEGIEVVFEEQPCDILVDSFISHKFWKRMQRQRTSL